MDALWQVFVRPLVDYEFMLYGFLVVSIVGLTSSVLSCLLVVRRQALLGDAISHAVLLGVVLGWLAGQQFGIFPGAMISAILVALAITCIERNSRVKLDAAMGIMSTFALAAGLAIISVVKPRGIDLFHVLLGNVLGVNDVDLWMTALSGLLVLSVVLICFRGFHLWSFDPVVAKAAGLPIRGLHYLFTALLAATIVAALQAVGVVLVVALLITPGATALLLTERLSRMMVVSAVVGILSGWGGLYSSYYLDVASGPSIVLFASFAFLLAFLFAPRRGILRRKGRAGALPAEG